MALRSREQERLDGLEHRAAKLDAALEDERISDFMHGLSSAIRARGGFSAAAQATGLNPTSLHKNPCSGRQSLPINSLTVA